MATHRKSIIKQAIERLDSKMAIGESRYEAKKAARAETNGEPHWSFSTGKIHSYKTRGTYQEHILRFITWARKTYRITDLAQLDPRADELATQYLLNGIAVKKSPYTLQTERSAFRLFFADRDLANAVEIPKRRRENITRSRRPAVRDRRFQPANWPQFMAFETACGLRRNELRQIKVGDVYHNGEQLVALVRNGKGGKRREVPVLVGCEQEVLALVADRNPEERILAKLPDTDIHALRREYAQSLYLHLAPGFDLPPKKGHLRPGDYNREAALAVSRALGHNRLDVVLNNYLR